MDTPTNLEVAVGALLATGNVPMAVGPGPVERVVGDDDLTAITRRFAPGVKVAGKPDLAWLVDQARVSYRKKAAAEVGVHLDLPCVLTTSPGIGVGEWTAADFTPQVLEDNGWNAYPYAVGVPLADDKRVRDNQRGRYIVLAGPEVPPTPMGSWLLTVSTLRARAVAAELRTWSKPMRRSDATRVQAEAEVYDTYASDAYARLLASFDWITDVPEPEPVQSFPSVPASMRGFARLGDSN